NAKGNGYGGIFRNSFGDVISVFIGRDKEDSMFQHELNAVHKGLQIASQQGITRKELASDSLRVIKAINKMEVAPWQYQNQLRDVWALA
ncbi:hypothetical protein FRX31_027113, partial [Thalictrum thalictroides]